METCIKPWCQAPYDAKFVGDTSLQSMWTETHTLVRTSDCRRNFTLVGASLKCYFGHATLWPLEVLFGKLLM